MSNEKNKKVIIIMLLLTLNLKGAMFLTPRTIN